MHPPRRHGLRVWLALGILLSLAAVPAGAQAPVDSSRARDALETAHPPGYPLPSCVVPAEQLADSIAFCMREVMYPRDLGESGKPEVSAAAAALLCRGARGREAGRSLSACVQGLLYERSGLGPRRPGMEVEVAALACRHATSQVAAEVVEDCMKRLLYERSGLGERRAELSTLAAATACQSAVAPTPPPYFYPPTCQPPTGREASRLLETCVRRLMYRRDGLGERREEVSGEVAAIACQGALLP